VKGGVLALLLALPVLAVTVKPFPVATPARLALTRQYCLRHYGRDSAALAAPQIIVIHATEVQTLEASLQAFKADKLPPARKDLRAGGELNVGVHFVVDRNGDIYSLLPLDLVGRHVIGFNYTAIGIENVGFSGHLTPAQLDANAALVEDLVQRLPSLHYLIGHYEYTDRSLPHYALFLERAADYRLTQKSDPGKDFMKKLRVLLGKHGVMMEP